jgi:hypothetical protein
MRLMRALYETRLPAFLHDPAAAVQDSMTALEADGGLGAGLVPAARVLVP